MRLSEKTPVVAAVVLVLAVAVGLGFWYVDVRQQVQTQHALEQTRDAFERFERERQAGIESPAALPKEKDAPAATVPHKPDAQPDSAAATAALPRTAAQPGAAPAARPAGGASSLHYLIAALLLTAIVALAIAGLTYRMVQRERRARMEERRVMRETAAERSSVFREADVTIIDAEPVDTVADGIPVYGHEPEPAKRSGEPLLDWLREAPVIAVLLRPSGEVEAVSAAFTRSTGYGAKDVPTLQTWLTRMQRVAADRIPAARESLRERFDGGGDVPVDMMVWTRPGEARHWLAQLATVPAGGDGKRWLLLATDVTERRHAEHAAIERAEQARREAENLDAAYQAAPVGLAVLDAQLKFVRVNETFGRMDGLRPADHLGKPLRKVLPHLATAAQPLLDQALHSGAASTGTWIAVRTPANPKSDRQWAVSCTPTKDAAGRVTGLMLAAEDVNDRHDDHLRTRESETALREILGHLPAPVCVKDTQGRYVYANPAYERFVRAAPGELTGKMDHEAFAWETADRLRDHDEDAIAAREAVASSGTVRLPDAEMHYAASKIALREGSGRPYAVCAVYSDWTAQQQAERELKAAEARYRAMFETAPQPVFIDRDNALVHVNAACVRLLAAHEPGELLGRSILEFLQPPAHQPFQERIQRVLARRAAEAPLEVKLRRLDGTVIDAEVDAALYETDGERAVQIVVRDVSERSRAEQALRGSEAGLRQIVEEAPVLVRSADANGDAVHWNGQWERCTGVPAAQGLGRQWLQQVHAEDRDALSQALAELRTRRAPMHIEYRLSQRGGTYRWMLETAAPRFDDAGTYLGHVACVTDVHERKCAEEALVRDATRFRDAAERAPALLWTESAEGIDFVNAALREQAGFDAEQAAGWLDRVHPEDCAAFLEQRRSAARADGPSYTEVRFENAGGEYRRMLATLVPRGGRGATSAGIVGSLIDVTDWRRAEQAARLADERRNAFVAGLAHELRTPLEPLRHAAEALRLTAEATEAKAASDIVVRQAQYLARLLEDATDASRLLRGPLPAERSVTDLGALVHRAVSEARPLIEARGQSLRIALRGGRAPVHVDARRVAQALTRLLDYAARGTPEDGVITVCAEELDGAPAIGVTVSGLSLPAGDASGLFELFHESDDRSVATSGIALPLVRQLIEAEGGKVDVEPTDSGARFTVRLPAFHAQTANAERTVSAAINGHRRVLVIDRDPDAAASLRMLLQLQGHDVRIAQDRAAAVPAAREFHPDTVVIDSAAAAEGPGELARALRLLPETAHAALLCVSTETAPGEDAPEGLFDHYLVKPVEPQLLQQVLAQTSPTLH